MKKLLASLIVCLVCLTGFSQPILRNYFTTNSTPVSTPSQIGGVKPDQVTTTVDGNGVISATGSTTNGTTPTTVTNIVNGISTNNYIEKTSGKGTNTSIFGTLTVHNTIAADTNRLPVTFQTATDSEYYRFDYGPNYGDFIFGPTIGFGNGLMLSVFSPGSPATTNVEFAISDNGPVYLPWGLVLYTNPNSNDAFGNPQTNALTAQGNIAITNLTPSTDLESSAGRIITSLPNANGAKTNNGSGGVGWSSAFSGSWIAPGTLPNTAGDNSWVVFTNVNRATVAESNLFAVIGFTGSGAPILSPTNSIDMTNNVTATTISFATNQYSYFLSGNITFTAVADFNAKSYRDVILYLFPGGSDRTVAFPGAFVLGGGDTLTVSNANYCTAYWVHIQPGITTNVSQKYWVHQ